MDKIRIDQHIRVIRATDMTLPQTSIKCRSDTLLSGTVKDFSQLGLGLLDTVKYLLYLLQKQKTTNDNQLIESLFLALQTTTSLSMLLDQENVNSSKELPKLSSD